MQAFKDVQRSSADRLYKDVNVTPVPFHGRSRVLPSRAKGSTLDVGTRYGRAATRDATALVPMPSDIRPWTGRVRAYYF